MKTKNIFLLLIIVLIILVVGLIFLRRPLVDYMKKSWEIEEAVNEALTMLGIEIADLEQAYNEEKSEKGIKWIYFTKKIRVPREISLKHCQEVISEEIKKRGGRILEAQLKEEDYLNRLSLQIGIGNIITHSLTLTQALYIARIAIIIDDFGYNKEVVDDFLKIKYPFTFAILPHCAYSQQISHQAKEAGKEIMLHLPMQGSYEKLEEGTIMLGMEEEKIEKITEQALNSISFIQGVNNHMGSIVTADKRVMLIVLKKIKERNFFFVDSFTSSRSIAHLLAKEVGLRAGRRDVFLDIEKNYDYIKRQVKNLADIAIKKKEAFAIGHAHYLTALVLEEMLPKLVEQGIQPVFASQLVK